MGVADGNDEKEFGCRAYTWGDPACGPGAAGRRRLGRIEGPQILSRVEGKAETVSLLKG